LLQHLQNKGLKGRKHEKGRKDKKEWGEERVRGKLKFSSDLN